MPSRQSTDHSPLMVVSVGVGLFTNFNGIRKGRAGEPIINQQVLPEMASPKTPSWFSPAAHSPLF
jgi:hypothetical protein